MRRSTSERPALWVLLPRLTAALSFAAALLVLLALAGAPSAHAQDQVIYSFTGGVDGGIPFGGLVEDKKGNLYGTTVNGGDFNFGTVFAVGHSGKEKVLYSFTNSNGDGAFPKSVIMDAAGNLYGVTGTGGLGFGTVFKIDSAGNEKVLYSFTNANGDGAYPSTGALLMDAAGNLYGTTAYGGPSANGACLFGPLPGCGIVYKLDPSGNETILYSFTGSGGDGSNPEGGLIMDAAGNLYGTTYDSGAFGAGTVFKLDPSGNETVLYSFMGSSDGAGPGAGLVMDITGNLYGTTVLGGTSGNGTVFKLDPAGIETVLHSFAGSPNDGSWPIGRLLLVNGKLVGTAQNGGTIGSGILFRMNTAGNEHVLVNFHGSNGAGPDQLLFDSKKRLFYGTTQTGGTSNEGTVYLFK